MKNKVILITGSTDGIGRQAALELAATGAKIIVHGRDTVRGERIVNEIRTATGNRNVDLLVADFSSLQQVRQLAGKILSWYERLDVLVNNAGVFMKSREMTEEGHEMTFAVNHLAPFLLTNLLLGLLRNSSPARVITVASVAHMRGKMDFENLQGERAFGGYNAYALSKLANILFTYELARRIEGTGVTANCLHPGVIDTKLLRTGFSFAGVHPADGASTIVYLATSVAVGKTSGKYFENKREVSSSPASHNTDFQKKLWAISETLTGLS
jgi:NAD(P)-dependent dehydrogenase (short-subunit alcohol dehydrogenase family)